MPDNKLKDVKFLVGYVKQLVPEIEKVHVSGVGKDAVFRDDLAGHKVLLSNGTAFLLPKYLEPDCKPGDAVFIKFSRSRHEGE